MLNTKLFHQLFLKNHPLKFLSIRGIIESSPKGPIKYDLDTRIWETSSFKEKCKILKDKYKNYFINLKNDIKAAYDKEALFLQNGDHYKMFTFDNPDSLKFWNVSTDSDWNEGFSSAKLEYNEKGFVTFHGYLDSESLPKDGEITSTGWANISNQMPPSFINSQGRFDFSDFTHITFKVRGDGRHLSIILRDKGNFDLTWLDIYQYNLYTRGGPYWQKVKIPFSKFILTSSGKIQDKQVPIPLSDISSIGLTLMDRYNGPFKLDIEYIGLEYDMRNYEEFSYEFYFVKEDKYYEIMN